MEYVAGYSIFNDVSARDYQKRTSQWLLESHSIPSAAGPALVTTDEVPDPHCLDFELTVNGVPKQRDNTRDIHFQGSFCLISEPGAALEPGDIIATGTRQTPEAASPRFFLSLGIW